MIDFFREFTVNVDSVGYVCSFAAFNFKQHGNPRYFEGGTGGGDGETIDNLMSREGKMEQSFVHFKANYP